VHVAQLCRPFFFGEHNEIVEAALPNMPHGDGRAPKHVCAGTGFGSKFSQQPMGEGLLQRGQHQRRISALRFGEEKMDMLRHDYVTDDYELGVSSAVVAVQVGRH